MYLKGAAGTPAARVQSAASRARRAVGLGVIFALTLAGPTSVVAQTTNPYADRNVPYGSPLATPVGTATTTTTENTTPATGSTSSTTDSNRSDRIQAVEVDSGRTTARDSEQDGTRGAQADRENGRTTEISAQQDTTRKPAPPGEFERYVERVVGRVLPRFGAELLVPGSRDFATPATASVPPSYILNVGDQIAVGMTGSLEGTLDAEIDTNGRVFIPRVGPVQLAGVRYGDLQGVLSRAIGQQFRDFRLTVAISQLRGIRVYVTGFANNPGAYTVSSLSTLVNAVLAAGGPSAGGSFRVVRLMRNGKLISTFDLYDLVRSGDRSRDAVLQNQDVIYIPPVGEQVALAGSVNDEAIYEAKPGDSLETMLGFAGGANVLADKSRVMLYRLSNLDTIGGKELSRTQTALTRVEGGDIVQVLSVGTIARPLERQAVLVRVEGEVNRPGNYYVPPNSSLGEVMSLAGGLTSRAFVYGTSLERVSVRQQQRAGFEEAVRQLEVSLAATPLTGDQTIDPGTRTAQVAAAQSVLSRLRAAQPDGRVVLDLQPASTVLPASLTLENNDRVFIPPRPNTVGVFGAVYRPASFLIGGAGPQSVKQYLAQAGGPLRVADRGQIFVVRANGSVLSKPNGALSAAVLPGDVIFVPVKTEASSLFQKILQISTIVFQLGLSAATIVAVTQ